VNNVTFVGLDVHKESISGAVLRPGAKAPEAFQLKHTVAGLRRLAKRLLSSASGPVVCAYEAGSVGYAPQRELRRLGVDCQVIAPSLVPIRPGDRLKTDRRDACKLAGLLRAGELVEVSPPTPEEEAVRDLCRAREDAKSDLLRSRHRLGKFLLRHGVRYGLGKKAWTKTHRRWLRGLRFEIAAQQLVFDDNLRAVELGEERVKDLETRLAEEAEREPWAEPVRCLMAFRGIGLVTAFSLVAELHGFARFSSPRQLMAYLGLVPSERSSGDRRRQGPLTKTGNRHVRRLLVEAAWHYRHRAYTGVLLRARRRQAPTWAVTIAERAEHRLHRRLWRLINRGKPSPKALAAVARELVGFIWSVLYPLSVAKA
jgi:transposase